MNELNEIKKLIKDIDLLCEYVRINPTHFKNGWEFEQFICDEGKIGVYLDIRKGNRTDHTVAIRLTIENKSSLELERNNWSNIVELPVSITMTHIYKYHKLLLQFVPLQNYKKELKIPKVIITNNKKINLRGYR